MTFKHNWQHTDGNDISREFLKQKKKTFGDVSRQATCRLLETIENLVKVTSLYLPMQYDGI